MNIKIIRNKKVFCKVINTKKKHKLIVYKPNTHIFFKFKAKKIIDAKDIDLENLNAILQTLVQLELQLER